MALSKKKENTKKLLHPRNKHRGRYNFKKLTAQNNELSAFVRPNAYGDQSIDFSNPEAVKALNKALLKTHYKLTFWDIPDGFLCPPIPGRADYIHYIADLLADSIKNNIPTGKKIKILDIGIGANCIYPIIGNHEYGWSFIGSDISITAIASAEKIIQNNQLESSIELRLQSNKRFVFTDILSANEKVDACICNPPFHSSKMEAEKANTRKTKNLGIKSDLNFGGQHNELWCDGGELKFIRDMIFESRRFSTQCFWFTTLVSKKENLKSIYRTLKKVEALDVKTIQMGQGNKLSRIVCWTFLSEKVQKAWIVENG